jgi:hypothetical protein
LRWFNVIGRASGRLSRKEISGERSVKQEGDFERAVG